MHVHFIALMRAVHILSGSLWVGATVLQALYLIPSVIAAGPGGGQVMRAMVQVRRLPVFMNSVMATALLSGAWLYWWESNGFSPGWIGSTAGLAFTAGALCAVATAAIGQFVSVPTVKRIGKIGAAITTSTGPPDAGQLARMGALQQRMLLAARVSAALLLVATLAMAMARFL